MKLTWFGGTTIRIHIGGVILVIDPDGAPMGIDAAELLSGAEQVVSNFGAGLPALDLPSWRPRKASRPLDDAEVPPPVNIWAVGRGTILIDAIEEPPLLLLSGTAPTLGRWADRAIVVLFGAQDSLRRVGQDLLADTPPRLLVLAADEAAVDLVIPALRDHLDGASLVALQARMALEA